MTSTTTTSSLALVPSLETAWQDVGRSFERFCLTAGIGAIEQMLCEDAQQLAGAPHSRGGGRVGHRWGRTKGKIGFHGGKVAVHRPRVRCAANLDGGPGRGLAWSLGHEPNAD
jgi:putative transposase